MCSPVKKLIFGVLCLILSSCAGGPPPTPLSVNQWSAVQNHKFENLNRDQFIEATKTVFTLSDGDTYSFYGTDIFTVDHADGPLLGKNNVDIWTFNFRQTENVLHVHAAVSNTYHGTYFRRAISQAGSIATYELLWERIEYILGRGQTWSTCEDAKIKYRDSKNANVTRLFVWCSPFHDDKEPRQIKR